MKRNLKAMAARHHDLIVVGGGIAGSTVAWDAALRGLSVALVEREDFSHATSAGSSKLVHGGLRYLANFELPLVRESLRERRIWEIIAPHMVDPLPFLLPTYGAGMESSFVMGTALTMYDLLSYDRTRLDDEDKRLPRHSHLTRGEALARAPMLAPEGLTGAKIYYDCQMYSPERLGLECLLGAAEYGAHIANYAGVTDFLKDGNRVVGVRVEDAITGDSHDIKGRVVVNAAGPWADKLLGLAQDGAPSRRLIRSKGIHLITRALTDDLALAVKSKIGGHFFVIPWRGHTILGTTDTAYEGDPADVGVTEQDIEDFLKVINEGLPGAQLTRADVLHFYAGLRPLVDETPQDSGDDKDTYGASRAAEVCDHAKEDGLDGFISAIGGKWTTSRHVAEQVVDLAIAKLARGYRPCQTHFTPIYGGQTGRFASFVERAKRNDSHLPEDVIANLAKNYGSRYRDVVALAENGGEQPLNNTLPDIGAEVVYAVRKEMAIQLSDVLFRRTGIGTLGFPGDAAISRCADLMAKELAWSPEEKERQMERALKRFETKAA